MLVFLCQYVHNAYLPTAETSRYYISTATRNELDQLGIVIDVVGELYPSKDGKGVDGKIGFVTKGELPPPMRLLPEQALKSSLSTINRTITQFAISSFQKGAQAQFREFLLSDTERSVANSQ